MCFSSTKVFIYMNRWKLMTKFLPTFCLLPWLAATACNREKSSSETQAKSQATGGEKEEEKAQKAEQKAEPGEQRDLSTSIDKPFEAIDVSGPVPPEISMVFFTVD